MIKTNSSTVGLRPWVAVGPGLVTLACGCLLDALDALRGRGCLSGCLSSLVAAALRALAVGSRAQATIGALIGGQRPSDWSERANQDRTSKSSPLRLPASYRTSWAGSSDAEVRSTWHKPGWRGHAVPWFEAKSEASRRSAILSIVVGHHAQLRPLNPRPSKSRKPWWKSAHDTEHRLRADGRRPARPTAGGQPIASHEHLIRLIVYRRRATSSPSGTWASGRLRIYRC